MEAKQLLGLDVGMARIGIARASSVARLAEPLMSIATDKAPATLKQLVNELSVELVVVGLPRTLNGNESKQTNWVRDWVSEVKDDLGPTFYWQDEALSTKTAELRQRSNGDPMDIDAMAAAIILQDFLDAPEADRVVC